MFYVDCIPISYRQDYDYLRYIYNVKFMWLAIHEALFFHIYFKQLCYKNLLKSDTYEPLSLFISLIISN